MARQDHLNRAENILSEASDAIADARDVLEILMRNDTWDKVFRQADDALKDAWDHLEDATQAVVYGAGSEGSGD